MDNGQTASGVNTAKNPDFMGCALPLGGYAKSKAELKALAGTPLPKMPLGVFANGKLNPDGAQVRFEDPETGRSITVPVIDLGPAKGTGHPGDLTVAAARYFDPKATANSFKRTLNIRILRGARFAPQPK